MEKLNKKLLLTLVMILIVGFFSGCGNGNLPDGIESKTFFKDINKVFTISLKSMSDEVYYEEDIQEVLDKMNDSSYKEKLNDYELSILDLMIETLANVKNDLTTGSMVTTSGTFSKIKSIEKMIEK